MNEQFSQLLIIKEIVMCLKQIIIGKPNDHLKFILKYMF